jgi:integrase family protein
MKKSRKKAGRRLNHEGSVCERKDGLIQASKMVNGKRLYFYSRDKAECYRWLDELKLKELQGLPIISGNVTLNELAQGYIERYAKPYVRPATLKNYQGYAENYINVSRIGKMKISRIAADDVQDFVNDIVSTGLRGKTVGNIAAFLDSVFAQAVRNRLIMYNPCESVRLPKKTTKERPLISEKEYDRLLESADTKTMRTGIAILGEGLRIGELLGLQWSDLIELEGIKVLNISKSLKREYIFDGKLEKKHGSKTKIRLSETKTDSSVRQVPVLPNVMAELEKLKEEQTMISKQFGIKFDNDCFIIGSVGSNGFTYITPDKFRSDFAKCVQRVGLPKTVTPHALRRYTSSTLIRHGANPVAVAKLLGHSNSSTTLMYYSRETLQGTLDAVMLLDK